MKRLIASALALSLIGGSAAMAQPHHDNRGNDRNDHRYEQKRMNHWQRGQRLPSQYRTRGHYVDYRKHHLRQPPRGYQWVQADNNYVMVALATGLISSIIANN